MLLTFTIGHFVYAWSTGSTMGQSSGIVIGQALDLTRGVFYRPIVGELGFGGTRYMPLLFVMVAGLIRLGENPVHAAFAIMLACNIALLAGMYVLLRRANVKPSLAAPFAALVFAAGCSQHAATVISNDLLPATLCLWGLAMIIQTGQGTARPRPFLAALFFILAFISRITTVFGLIAALLGLAMNRRWRDAFVLAICSVAGILLSLWLIEYASDGRFGENMRAGAACSASWEFVRTKWLPRLFNDLSGFGADWITAMTTIIALLILLTSRNVRDTLFIALATSLLGTAALYMSPGVSFNNFLDLYLVEIALILIQISRRLPASPVLASACGAVAIAAIPYLQFHHPDLGWTYAQSTKLLCLLDSDDQPVLINDATPLIELGQSPLILDPWMFRRLVTLDASVAQEFRRKLIQQEIPLIMLRVPLGEPQSRTYLSDLFGPEFEPLTMENYHRETAVSDPMRLHLYRPNSSRPDSDSSGAMIHAPSLNRTF